MIFSKKSFKPGEKITPPSAESEAQKYSLSEADVYVMPNKFVTVKSLAPNPVKRGALVLVFLVIFLGLIVGGGIWFINKNQTQPKSTNVVNTSRNTDNNVNNNINTTENSININNSNQDLDQNNQNNNININFNNINTEPVVVILDIDNDGLTALEETLYKTDPQVADTDKDGYSDGQEIVSLYNPLVSGVKLSDSALVTKYSNNNFTYELLYPRAWLVKSLDENRGQVSLIPDSGTGESISVNVLANIQHLELLDWKKTLYLDQSLDNFSLSGRPALRTSDGRQVLLVTYDNVYTIVYDTSQSDKNFMATFNMILSSFKLSGASIK